VRVETWSFVIVDFTYSLDDKYFSPLIFTITYGLKYSVQELMSKVTGRKQELSNLRSSRLM
jgi:hypothetical protein